MDGQTTKEEAIATARIIYNKLYESFAERGTMEKTVETDIWLVGDVTVSIGIIKIFNALISSPEDLMT